MVKLYLTSLVLFVNIVYAIGLYGMQADLEVDARYETIEFKEHDGGFKRSSLAFREVVRDRKGDRLIFYLRGEAKDNFSEFSMEQLFAQLKGPMGAWKISLGRFMVPFGLNENYETENLLVEIFTEEVIGKKYDTGVGISGQVMSLNYSFSVTQGIDENRWIDNDYDKLVSLRIGTSGIDYEDFNIGFSGMLGSVYSEGIKQYKKFFSVDGIKYYDLFIFRGELVLGQNDQTKVYGCFLGMDYRFYPSFDLNLAFNIYKENDLDISTTLGFTYHTPWHGFVLRVAHKLTFGGWQNETFFQVFNRYSIVF